MEQVTRPQPPALPRRSTRPGTERRTAPRIPLDVGVGFRSESNFYLGFAEDISEGGLFVATFNLQPIGTDIELTFALPDGTEFTVHAVVRWLRDPHDNHHDECRPGMGVQFTDLSHEVREAIHAFIALREPMFFDS